MRALDLPAEVLSRAFALIRIAETVSPAYVTEMVAAWLRDDLDQATHIVMALAFLADEDKALKQAHAAHGRLRAHSLPVPEEIEALEREYQRIRKGKNRRVAAEIVSIREAG